MKVVFGFLETTFLFIQIREMATWHTATISKIIEESSFVKRFFLQVNGVDVFDFLPGQFITLDLPISDKRQKRWRSYSIANAPSESNQIELCIVKKYDGAGSNYLFNLHVGDELTFKGPDGAFTLPKSIEEKTLVMICTGTGIAPFRSFIHYVINQKLNFKKMHLIFGARLEADILYRAEFEDLAKQYDNFYYDIALSREENWHGHKGYVHDIYKKIYSNDIEDTLFYLCGWTVMIDEAVANLIVNMKCDKNQVVYELYG